MAQKIMAGGRSAAVSVSFVNAGSLGLLKVKAGASNDGKEAHSVTILLDSEDLAALRESFEQTASPSVVLAEMTNRK